MEWSPQVIALVTRYTPAFATVLVIAGALWIGTLFSVSWLCGRARMMADGPEIGRLAASLFGHWTVPSLLVSLVAGAGLWLVAFERQGHARWLYVAVIAELLLIVISAHVGLRARRVGSGLEPT